MELEGNSCAATSVTFLQQLRANHTEPLIVIWDNGPAHGGDAVRTYLTTPDLQLRLVRLPAYSPDFNPDEAIWGWIREEVTANTCFGTKAKVQQHVGQFFRDIAQRTDEVKRRWRNGYLGMLSSNSAVASAALAQIRRGRGPEALATWPNELMQISIEQCRATAQKWLSNAQPSIAVAGLPGKLARGLNLDARIRALQWTYDLQEQRKL